MRKSKAINTEMVQIAQRNHYEWKRRRNSRFNWKPLAIGVVTAAAVAIGATTLALGSSEQVNRTAEVPTYEVPRNYYPLTTVVTEINHAEDLVTVRTSSGYKYQFHGVEDWWPGDLCSCLMDNKGTAQIDDDIILMKRYCGVPSSFILG